MSEPVPALFAALSRGSDRVALRCDGRDFTFAELDERSRRWQTRLLAMGGTPGDRVAALLEPSVDAVCAMLGAYRARLRWVPINPRYRGPEVAHIAEDSRPVAVLSDPDLADLVPTHHRCVPLAPGELEATPPAPPGAFPRPTDGALLIYTSGTTGRSKGVDLSHGAVTAAIGALTGAWRWEACDRLCLPLPLFHVHGLCIGIHGALLHEMTVLLHRRFSAPAVVADFEAGATVFMGVPTMYVRLLDHLDEHPADAEALRRGRLFTAGSAALSGSVLRRFEALTGHRILERYGMSETLITVSNPYEGQRREGSVGTPIAGVQIRIVDDAGVDVDPGERGELWVRAEGMMTGYFGRPEATREAFTDGWFRTDDVVVADPDGYLRIVGRQSTDIVKSGGFKIATREVEEVLVAHDGVAEVAVVGATDPTWGERVVAAIVARPGVPPSAPAAWLEDLQRFARQHLADYKVPRQILVLEELPRNALGKVLKPTLRAWAETDPSTTAP